MYLGYVPTGKITCDVIYVRGGRMVADEAGGD